MLAKYLIAALLVSTGCVVGRLGPSPPALDGGLSFEEDAPRLAGTGPVLSGPGRVTTQRNDPGRTGANLDESVLTTATVNRLEVVARWPVSGEVYAQVLVADGVSTAYGPRNLALVATLDSMLMAFDLDSLSPAPIWILGTERELGGPPYSDPAIGVNNGILGTPVIDRARGAVYLVSRDCEPALLAEAPPCRQRLFAVDLGSGKIRDTTVIQGSVAINAVPVPFEPAAHRNRAALLLAGGRVLVAFAPGPSTGQHEEDFVYHGWVFAYDAANLSRPPAIYCTTPRGRGGGIWQAGSGPAGDEQGLYFATGNGIVDGATQPADFPAVPGDQEDSVVRLPVSGPFPAAGEPVAHYWDSRPYRPDGNVFQFMEKNDGEIGSSGPLLIPGTRRMVVGSKPGILYAIDRDTMRETQVPLSPFHALPLQAGHTLYLHAWWGLPVINQTPVFWRPDDPQTGAPAQQGLIFAWASDDRLESFRYDYQSGLIEEWLTSGLPPSSGGANLVLSANGGHPGSALLWATTREGEGPAGRLRALDPITFAVLFDTELPAWSRFTPPTVARGLVLVPSTSTDPTVFREVLVFGVRAERQ
jgi:hypothetical protein